MQKRVILVLCTSFCLNLSTIQAGNLLDSLEIRKLHGNQPKDSINLPEVEVKALHPLVRMKAGTMIYDVEYDSDAQSKSMMDVMHKVPLLVVNKQTEITAEGDKSIVYKINGVYDPLLKGDVSTMLQALGAKYVKRVEVIPQPGIQYGPNAIVVNFVTKGRLEGLFGNVANTARDNLLHPTAKITSKYKRLMFAFGAGNIWWFDHQEKTTADEYRLAEPDQYELHTEKTSHGFRSNGIDMDLDVSYDINDNTLLNAYGRVVLNSQSNPHTDYTLKGAMYREDGSLNYAYSQRIHDLYKNTEYDMTLSMEHNFVKDKCTLGKLFVGYNYYDHPANETVTAIYDKIDSLTMTSGSLNSFFNYVQRTQYRIPMHTINLEFWHNLGEHHLVTLGGKYMLRPHSTDYAQQRMDLNSDVWKDVPEEKQRNQMTEQVLSAYTSYTLSYNRLKMSFGATYEYQYDKLRHTTASHNFTKSFGNILPSYNCSFDCSRSLSMEFAYAMGVSRPNMTALDPHVDNTVPMQQTYGNLDLRPEKNHTMSLTSYLRIKQYLLVTSVTQTFSNDMLLSHSFLEGDILHNTTDNLGKRSFTNLSISASGRVLRNLFLRLRQNVNYASYRASAIDERNHGWYYSVRGSLEWTLGKGLYLSSSGSYHTRELLFQGWGSEGYDYDISLTKYLLKDKLRISCSAGNFMPTHVNYKTNKNTQNYQYASWKRTYVANFSLGISYTFGKLKARMKNIDKEIQRDNDIKYNYDN